MINVLITSASRKVSLVKYFQDALNQEGGGKVITADINPLSAALHISDKGYLVPKSIENNFIPVLLDICKKEKISIIIPTRDEELPIFAKNIDRFKNIGTKVMVASQKTIEICGDKQNFSSFCIKNNIPVPRTYSKHYVQNPDIILKFPLFINNRFGKGSKNIFKVYNKEELGIYLGRIKDPIIQEYCSDKEYTIDLFSDFQGNVISVVPRERISVFGGESFVGRTYKNQKLIMENVNLAKKLGLIGHNTIQCFFDGKSDIKFIEVNPRYGGGASLGFAAGQNTPLFLIRILKGKKIKNEIGNFRDSFVMLRYTDDIFLDERKARSVEKID